MPASKRKASVVTSQELISAIDKFKEQAHKEHGRWPYALSQKDLTVQFDFENVNDDYVVAPGEELLGIRQLVTNSYQKPFTFLVCEAGGDWEWPVIFIVYLDNKKKVRAYVPKSGNVFNYDTKEAFGNFDEADKKFLLKWFKKQDPDCVKELEKERYFDALEWCDVMLDTLLIKSDIKQRIEVV